MNDEQRIMLDKADRALLSARVLLDADDVDGALNRAYYGAFYAATAALLGRGESPKAHSGTHSRFSFHFVRTGLVAPTTGSLLKSTFDDRQRADYDAISIFDTRAAADALADAEALTSSSPSGVVAAVRPLVTAP